MSVLTLLFTFLLGPLGLLLETVYGLVNRVLHSPGWSVVVLCLGVNFLMLLLYNRVDAIRKASHETREGVRHIHDTIPDEERKAALREFRRQNPVRPVAGLAVLLLELPFFFAVCHFLTNVSVLNGASFGAIRDLSAPDGWLTIGAVCINVLPVVMTLLGLLSAGIYLKGAPLPDKILLYGMTLLFGVVLYKAPAALALYWTLNNLFFIFRTLICKLKGSRALLNILLCIVGVALMVWGYYVADMIQLKRGLLMVAVGGACMLPAVLSSEGVSKRLKATLREGKPDWKKFLLGTGLMTVLVGLLIPSAYLAAAPEVFVDAVYFHDPQWYLASTACLACGIFLLWMNVIYGLAGKMGKVLLERLSWVAGAAMLVCYFFFGTEAGGITGQLQYKELLYFHVGPQLFNLLVVALVAVAVYIIAMKWSRLGSVAMLAAVLVLTGMGVSNGIKLHRAVEQIISQVEQEQNQTFRLSTEGRNVVVLTLNRAAAEYIPYIFNEKPELKEQFDGFTFYENTLGFSPSTRTSISSLYGGYEYTPVEMNRRDEELLVDKHNESLKMLPVLFLEEGYEVTVCNPAQTNYRWEPDMSVFADHPQINTITEQVMYQNLATKRQIIRSNYRNFFCFSLMKTMPLAVQTVIYDGGNYGRMSMDGDESSTQTFLDVSHAENTNWRCESNYKMLQKLPQMTQITESADNTLLCMTNEMTVVPTLLQTPDYEPARQVDNGAYDDAYADRFQLDGESIQMTTKDQIGYYHVNMAAMLQLGNWFDYLRENGVYDNTRIILAADHSWCLRSKEELVLSDDQSVMDLELYNSLLMVKDFDARGFSTSEEFMTAADVPTLAVTELVENPTNPFTGKPINSDEKTAHDQFVFMTWDKASESATTIEAGLWGSVHGDMRRPENWTFYEEEMVLSEHEAP